MADRGFQSSDGVSCSLSHVCGQNFCRIIAHKIEIPFRGNLSGPCRSEEVSNQNGSWIFPLPKHAVITRHFGNLRRAWVAEPFVNTQCNSAVGVIRQTAAQHKRILNGHTSALTHVRSRRMRRVAQQSATFLAPSLRGSTIVNTSFDDGGWVSCADDVWYRSVPALEPAKQFELRTIWPVVGEFYLVRRAPPSGAAVANRNHTHSKPGAKRLSQ